MYVAMEIQLRRITFLFCALMMLTGLGGVGIFAFLNDYLENSYRLVTLFLILILVSNILVDISTYE